MIKIGVDGNEANVEKKSGVSVYALNILKYFYKVASHENSICCLLKNNPLTDLPQENKYFKYKIITENFLVSNLFTHLFIFHKDIDVYFSPAHYLPRFCPVPQVVTIHDLAYLYFPEDFTKKIYGS